jgi:hypothetical protein
MVELKGFYIQIFLCLADCLQIVVFFFFFFFIFYFLIFFFEILDLCSSS